MGHRRRYDDSLRADLLRAAARALAADGEAAISIRTVAADAGTTTAGVYALFGSRDQLVDKVVGDGLAQFQRRIAERKRHEDPLADLVGLCHAYRRAALEMPQVYRALGVVARRREVPMLGGPEQMTLVGPAVARVLGTGPDDAETYEHAITLCALVHGLVLLEIDNVLTGGEGENGERFGRALDRLVLTTTRRAPAPGTPTEESER